MLKHFSSSDDLNEFHFDLLLEDGGQCRSWRLSDIPELDGPGLDVVAISPHSLSWLNSSGRAVSGGRGFAFPVSSGFFLGKLPSNEASSLKIELIGQELNGLIEIAKNQCFFRSSVSM